MAARYIAYPPGAGPLSPDEFLRAQRFALRLLRLDAQVRLLRLDEQELLDQVLEERLDATIAALRSVRPEANLDTATLVAWVYRNQLLPSTLGFGLQWLLDAYAEAQMPLAAETCDAALLQLAEDEADARLLPSFVADLGVLYETYVRRVVYAGVVAGPMLERDVRLALRLYIQNTRDQLPALEEYAARMGERYYDLLDECKPGPMAELQRAFERMYALAPQRTSEHGYLPGPPSPPGEYGAAPRREALPATRTAARRSRRTTPY